MDRLSLFVVVRCKIMQLEMEYVMLWREERKRLKKDIIVYLKH